MRLSLSHPVVAAALVATMAGRPAAPCAADILVADFKTGFGAYDDRVLRYDEKTGQFLGEFVGAGRPLDGPTDMAFGPGGDLYVTSIYITNGGSNSANIIQYDGKTGALVRELVRVGSGGLCGPGGLAFGPDQNLYVTSGCGGVVLKFDGATGAPLGQFIGHSTFPPAGVNAPVQLFFGPDQRVYVTERHDSTIRRFDLTGAPTGGFFTEGFGSTAMAHGMALADRRLYVALYGWDDIAVFDFDTGAFLNFISVLDPAFGLFQGGPYSLAFGPDGLLYCSNHLDSAVIAINPQTGSIVRRLDPDNVAGLDRPAAILFMPAPTTCYADCNDDQALNVLDFVCFQQRFAASDPSADCDQSGSLNVNDFVCFQTRFAAGCP